MKTLSSFIAVLFLLTLSFSAQAGSIIEELKNEGVLKLYHDYRSGHVLDLSGNAYRYVRVQAVCGAGDDTTADAWITSNNN